MIVLYALVWVVLVVSRVGGGAAMLTGLSIPEAPHPVPREIQCGTPNVVLDGERYAIGWQRFSANKGGPAYVTARRGILGGRRVLDRYPLTDDGWARAWAAFAQLDPVTAEKTRAALARLSAARPPAGRIAFLTGLVLRAIDPSADGFAVGQAYDLQFGKDGVQIARSGSPEALAEYRYADVEAVQVTGFERVLPVPKLLEVLFSPLTLRPRSSYSQWIEDLQQNRTHLRVQALDRELYFWCATALTPVSYRRFLEQVSRAIRQAWLSVGAEKAEGRTEWLVSELSRLAERLEHGTLTRSDFDLLKARIIGGY
jgi:hypothetical protein